MKREREGGKGRRQQQIITDNPEKINSIRRVGCEVNKGYLTTYDEIKATVSRENGSTVPLDPNYHITSNGF